MIAQLPSIPQMARENREFLGRAVRHLVSGLGVRQFLDIMERPDVFGTLDRSQPIALMLISVLMYFTDQQAHAIVATLLDALPSGSYLTVSHPTADFAPAAAAVARRAGLTYHTRTQAEVGRFFTGESSPKPLTPPTPRSGATGTESTAGR